MVAAAPVTGYLLTCCTADGQEVSRVAGGLICGGTVHGLTEGTAYEISVVAECELDPKYQIQGMFQQGKTLNYCATVPHSSSRLRVVANQQNNQQWHCVLCACLCCCYQSNPTSHAAPRHQIVLDKWL